MPRYEVVLVRYRCPHPPPSWRDLPKSFGEVGRLFAGPCRPLANAFARAFNRAEQQRPRGVWAMVRQVRG